MLVDEEIILKAPERRRHIRIPFWSIIRYRVKNGSPDTEENEVVYGNSLNLSINGICFETYAPLQSGSKIEITLALPTYPLRKINIDGEVLRCEKVHHTSLFTVAVSFTNVPQQDSFAFAEFVEHYLK